MKFGTCFARRLVATTMFGLIAATSLTASENPSSRPQAESVQDAEPTGQTPKDEVANEDVHKGEVKVQKDQIEVVTSELPDPPKAVTSFGAAIAGGKLYVYGGHTGNAHSYSVQTQTGHFSCLDLRSDPSATSQGASSSRQSNKLQWQTLPAGPRLQGLAMVADGEDVIRIGGFTAMNQENEDADLRSQSDVARFRADLGQWQTLPDLPEPRSSTDAIVGGRTLYVAGGWAMQGDDEARWLDTAWSLDLADPDARWQALGESFPPRRAISTAFLDGKLYVIGGMLPEGKTTGEVLVYDPQTSRWSSGPELPGESMNGFGTAACVADGHLYVNTINGYVFRLDPQSESWDAIGQLDPPRFFHRMVTRPASDPTSLMLIGGVNMKLGKFTQIDLIRLQGP